MVLPAQMMELLVPSPDQVASPRQQFPPADPKSIACLQAAFGPDFVAEHLVHKMTKVRGTPCSAWFCAPTQHALVADTWRAHCVIDNARCPS